MQRGAGRERGAGRGERVGDVEPGGAPEGRREQMRPGQLHAAPAVLDDDHVAALGLLEDHRPAAAAAVPLDELAAFSPGILQ